MKDYEEDTSPTQQREPKTSEIRLVKNNKKKIDYDSANDSDGNYSVKSDWSINDKYIMCKFLVIKCKFNKSVLFI